MMTAGIALLGDLQTLCLWYHKIDRKNFEVWAGPYFISPAGEMNPSGTVAEQEAEMSEKELFVVEPQALSDALEQRLAAYKILYITAATGWGKTAAVQFHFRAVPHTCASMWDDDALERVEQDATGLTILDDFQVIIGQPDLQKRLLAHLRTAPAQTRLVILSRAPLPEWLLPFQLAGLLDPLDRSVFALGTGEIARLAEHMGLELPQEDVLRLCRESRGHPLAARLICMELAEGGPLNSGTVRRSYARMFAFLDRELFSYWDAKIRRLLLSASFFDSFTLGLAQALTGDSQVEQTLTRLLHISGFIDKTGDVYVIRYGPFRAYLRHKAETTWSRQEVDALFASAGTYFQLQGDLPAALDCWSRNGSHAKVSELLAEHSKQHPGHGVYYQLRKYYRSLPEAEILASPQLMCGMSVLCSLTFETEESEKWYGALKAYADRLDRRNPERRTVQGLLDYLDVVLPHRGSVNIKDILLAVAGRLEKDGGQMPECSVTSNLPSILRGGKDFSRWVPNDKLLYDTIRVPVAAVLGRQGVGLPEVALAESRYEKGEDITGSFLTLSSRRVEIQRKGAPEIEFVLTALLAKCQCDSGNVGQAVQDLSAFRARMERTGRKQLLPNIDALLCRIDLLSGGEYAHQWFTEDAPDENDFFIMERYRYHTKVRCYLQRGENLTALALLGRLLDYFTQYDRTLDRIETLVLLAVCRYRMDAGDWRGHLAAALELAGEYGFVRVFAHQGAALLPALRAWKPPSEEWETKKRAAFLTRVRKSVGAFAAMYPDYLAPSGSAAVQDLTRKELEVLRLMGRGKTNAEIRRLLNISENTLKTHNRNLFQKLGVNSRTEAAAVARKLHLI